MIFFILVITNYSILKEAIAVYASVTGNSTHANSFK